MIRVKEFYLSKKQLYPSFGMSYPDIKTIAIRSGMPTPVQKFVRVHETYHVFDETKWWLWREIKANVVAARQHPIGFVMCCCMSLAPYRLKYYFNRFRKGE